MQYLQKSMGYEIDFLPPDKHKNFLQIWWRLSSISKVPKIASSQCLWNISKKKLEMKLIFLHADKHQSGLQVDFNTLGTKFGYKVILWLLINMIKHSQITQSKKSANLCNISKKLGMEFIFRMQINTISFLMKTAN